MKHFKSIIFLSLLVSLLVMFTAGLLATENAKECEHAEKCCCLLCDHQLTAETAQFKVEYKGKTYFFCNEECKTKFEKDPEKCLEYAKAQKEKVVYICPMKQCGVKSDKPGKCPKCGMELKKTTKAKLCAKSCCMKKPKLSQKEGHTHSNCNDHKHE